MKQWNGTSFDNVFPNAGKLDGKTFDEIVQYAQSKNLLLYTGEYIGTGTYGKSNPSTLTFPFEPILFVTPMNYDVKNDVGNSSPSLSSILPCAMLTEDYKAFKLFASGYQTKIKLSFDRKTLSFYSTENQVAQFNNSAYHYYYAAIGGYDMGGEIVVGSTYTITSNQNWKVPATGRWMLELYGMGGKGYARSSQDGYSGGASCQHYDSITLTKDDIQQIVIGNETNVSTKFGTYSVDNAGGATSSAGGKGTGNRGRDGVRWAGGASRPNYGTGEISEKYGYGIATSVGNGGPGAVYLKYLGE